MYIYDIFTTKTFQTMCSGKLCFSRRGEDDGDGGCGGAFLG